MTQNRFQSPLLALLIMSALSLTACQKAAFEQVSDRGVKLETPDDPDGDLPDISEVNSGTVLAATDNESQIVLSGTVGSPVQEMVVSNDAQPIKVHTGFFGILDNWF